MKVEVSVLGSPSLIILTYCLCGRKATVTSNETWRRQHESDVTYCGCHSVWLCEESAFYFFILTSTSWTLRTVVVTVCGSAKKVLFIFLF